MKFFNGMPRFKWLLAAALITLWVDLPLAVAQNALLTPVGLWRSIDDKTGQAKAEIRIRAASNGTLTGVIEKPLAVGQSPLCTACTDDRKDQPKVGMEIIRGARQVEGKDVWEGGKILEPDSGRVYTLRMSPAEGGTKLELRASFGPIGRTQTWLRIN